MKSIHAKRAVKTPLRLRMSADCYLQKFIKYPRVAECHSWSELLYLALLESDPSVTSFTPRPERLKVNGRQYIPDCFYVKNGERVYVELKPRGEFKDEIRLPLEDYAARYGCKFEVLANETILKQVIKAKNWLHIIRTLVSATHEDTSESEEWILEVLYYDRSLRIADVVDQFDRIGNRDKEIGLYRLAWEGLVHLELDEKPINCDTRVICRQSAPTVERMKSNLLIGE